MAKSKINILPENIANQIAAGEVVIRPASALKELIENSIDSGATKISINIEQGGIKKIQVTDNGCGISKIDIPNALLRHATSKIKTETDLYSIGSLGFRGEALSSISSVALFEIISTENPHASPRILIDNEIETQESNIRNYDDLSGWALRTNTKNYDKNITPEPATHPYGTTVKIEDLFFNVPARRHFLNTERTEFKHCEKCFLNYVLQYFDIHWQLKHNNKLLYDLPICKNQKEKRLIIIMGEDFCKNSSYIEVQENNMSLSGWVGMPIIAKNNPDQFFYVNNRPIKDKTLYQSIHKSFQDVLHQQKQPPFVLSMSIEPGLIDVNIHPNKQELRFRNQHQVFSFFYKTFNSLIDKFNPSNYNYANINKLSSYNKQKEKNTSYKNTSESYSFSKNFLDDKGNFGHESTKTKPNISSNTISSSYDTNSDKLDIFEAFVKKNDFYEDKKNNYLDKNTLKDTDYISNKKPRSQEPNESTLGNNTRNIISNKSNDKKNILTEIRNEKNEIISDIPPLGFAIGQIKQIYIVSINVEGLILVDMHASHERVLYENLKILAKKDKKNIQNLLIPIIIRLNKRQILWFERLEKHFNNLGFNIDILEDNTISIHSVPNILNNHKDIASIVLDILQNNIDDVDSSLIQDHLHKLLSNSACRHSLRSGASLNIDEMNKLLRQIETTNRSNQCNHGRPTYVKLDMKDLDSLFLRGQ